MTRQIILKSVKDLIKFVQIDKDEETYEKNESESEFYNSSIISVKEGEIKLHFWKILKLIVDLVCQAKLKKNQENQLMITL